MFDIEKFEVDFSSSMKIMSWNCQNGLNEEKAGTILEKFPDVDIFVIQECRQAIIDIFNVDWQFKHWHGDEQEGNDLGIAIFSRKHEVELIETFNHEFRYIVPYKVKNGKKTLTLFAVWLRPVPFLDNKNLIQAFSCYENLLNDDVILIGDCKSVYSIESKQNLLEVWNYLEKFKIRSIGDNPHNPEFITFTGDICFVSKKIGTSGLGLSRQIDNDDLWNGLNSWYGLSDRIPVILDTRPSSIDDWLKIKLNIKTERLLKIAKYNIDLDYAIPDIDVSKEELRDIIAEADKLIIENTESPEKLAIAYLKKAQCMHKLDNKMVDLDLFILSLLPIPKDTLESIKIMVEKSLELSPNLPEALMQLGKNNFFTPNENEAMQMYSRAIEIKPDYAAAFNNRGILNAKDTDDWGVPDSAFEPSFEKALADFSEAIRLRPYNAAYYFNRSTIYKKMEEYEKAKSDLMNLIDYGSDEFKKQILFRYLTRQKYKTLVDYQMIINDFHDTAKQKQILMKAFEETSNGLDDFLFIS